MYKDETSSVTNNELEGRLPMVRSLLRKSLVSLALRARHQSLPLRARPAKRLRRRQSFTAVGDRSDFILETLPVSKKLVIY